jgi:hypothetical protein
LMNSIFSTNDVVCIPNDSNSCRNSFVFIDDGSISRSGSVSKRSVHEVAVVCVVCGVIGAQMLSMIVIFVGDFFDQPCSGKDSPFQYHDR